MSTTVYTYNDRLVGVGNDQILGTSQGGGASYTAGDYISIDNDEISVTGISAGDGTLSIAQNVTGAPLNIIYPTDVAPLAETYNLKNNVDGLSGQIIAYRSPGYDQDYYSNSTASIVLEVPETVTGVAYINFYYSREDSKYSTGSTGPSAATTLSFQGPDYIVQAGKYITKMQANSVPQSAGYGYGKYISVWLTGPGPDMTKAQLINAYIAAPDPSLGVDVDLDRYYLGGNIVGTKPNNTDLQAQIWLNPETKKQEVYLPGSVPYSWNLYGNTFTSYTSTPTNISAGTTINNIAYKYDSSTGKYIYARMTSSIKDTANSIKKAEFVTLEPVSGKFEKWTYDYSNSSDRHWTTETIETGGGGASYTAGDYISIENDEIAVTGVGNLVAGNNITITESGNNITISSEGGGSTYTAGQYISIDGNDVIAVTGLAPVSGSDGIAVDNNVVSLDTPVEIVAGENITISVTGASAIISAQTGTSYTEGNCIDITSNAISWETSAGITDIVSVTALPANPVATVIYLIPET